MKISSRRDYKGGHSIELLRSGENYFAALEKVIDNAVYYIHFQTYIIDEDVTGNRIIDALVRASQRKVRVYLLLDAFGTRYLTAGFIKKIEDAGIRFRFFSPTLITKGFMLSLRLHHKVLLADGNVSIIGGINVADRYHGNPRKKEWLDFALKFQGPECIRVLLIAERLWNRTFLSKKEKSHEKVYHPALQKENIRLKVLQNNWYRNKIEILKTYRSAIRHSQKRMIMFCGYFLPGRHERKLLRSAAKRGVDIKIVLSGDSDAPMFSRATNFLYRFILQNNIKIYEYLPSNLHAKVATVDGKWSTIGSYNLNHLSDYGSIETNVDIDDAGFTRRFESILLRIISKDCRQVTFDDYVQRKTWLFRLPDWISYQMIRFMMRLMFLMTGKRKKLV
jgi:cardiolipin synthase